MRSTGSSTGRAKRAMTGKVAKEKGRKERREITRATARARVITMATSWCQRPQMAGSCATLSMHKVAVENAVVFMHAG